MTELVADALLVNRAEIARLGLSVDNEMIEADVSGNTTLLARMVANVVDNAVRHNVTGGRIHIFNDFEGSRVRLVVDSGGPQIDPQKAQQLGEPFRKLGTERTANGDGAGLGLSIVRAIANAHGGALQVQALPVGGLRVVIELPAAPILV
jgi:signal transduction histidine kinase